MKTTDNIKPDVHNPCSLLTPIGKELVFIFKSYNKDIDILDIPNIEQKEKLSKSILKKAKDTLKLDDSFIDAMLRFQSNYSIQKAKGKENFKEACSQYKKLKSVLPLIKENEKIGFDNLEDIVLFFDCDNEKDVFNHIEVTKTFFRKQKQCEIDEVNLSGWIRRGNIDFENRKNKMQYDRNKLLHWVENGEWKSKIEDERYFKNLPTKFNEFGVNLFLYPYIPKTIHGCAKWIDNKPLIMISDRGNDKASCWVTLFHEIGHILLHENQEIYDIELDNKTQAKIEVDANRFANQYLFGGDDLQKRVFFVKKQGIKTTKEALAGEYNTHPLLAKYWMRKAGLIPPNYIDRIIFNL